jgi:hypothetical protein
MRRRLRSLTAVVLAALLGGLVPAAPVLADADPPSDILVGLDYYVPYTPPVDKAHANQLATLLKDAHAGGHAYKVAIIATPADLGAVTSLFTQPAPTYAKFLWREIQAYIAGASATLLVVMPQGLALGGGPDATPAGKAALRSIKVPAHPSSTQLATVAVTAVRAIAAANGHPLPQVGLAKASGGGSSSTRWIVISAIAVAVVGGGLIALGARGRPGPADPAQP